MGNILCRDKSPRRVYVRGPQKGAADYDPHLFQADSLVNGTKKEPNNPIFYSTPNLNNSDMKSTISLDARIFDSGNFNRPPVAPPRKKKGTLKKGSTLPATFSNDSVRNGFKDVFGNSTSISSSNYDDIDYIDKEEEEEQNSLQDRSTSTPEKKLRVGNRKSDKFFGEILSDRISDEPISPISKTSDESANDSADSKSQTDKKLSFFLMNMLDDIRDATDAERYKDRQPVEEPLVVAKKRVTKHICDDDDHMHSHIHGHTHDSDPSTAAPPKPDRDFTKFKAPENENVIEIKTISAEKKSSPEEREEVPTKVVVKRGISRENLPSPPATPQRRSGVSSLSSTPTITIETIEPCTVVSSTVDGEKRESAAAEKKEQQQRADDSSQNISEMVDEMIKKAYGMSDFHPEDQSHSTHDELVTPTSKLAVRKISTPRKVSTASTPDADSIKSFELPVHTAPFKKTSLYEDPAKLDKMLEESHRKFYDVDEAARVPQQQQQPQEPPCVLEKQVKLSGIALIGAGGTMNDIIDEIYSKNSEVMQEFQSFLEQSLEKEPVIDVAEEKKFVESKKTLGDDDPLPPREHEDGLDNCSYSDSFESSDTEPEVLIKAPNEIANNHHLKRRESIEDIDNWFSNHVETKETESDVCNSSSRNDPQRQQPGYDTQKIFPFGSTITGRRDSLSDEFFSEHPVRIKPHIEGVGHMVSSISEDTEAKEGEEKESRESSESRDSHKSKSPDHSTLLKYFDNSVTDHGATDESNKKQVP